MTGVFGTKGGYHALTTCDTLLLLGCDFAWRQFYPEWATIIQIDIDGAHLGRRHPVNIGAVGDIAPTLEALLPRIQPAQIARFWMLPCRKPGRRRQNWTGAQFRELARFIRNIW
jgi:pyruvate dehydrogenase (quinone)